MAKERELQRPSRESKQKLIDEPVLEPSEVLQEGVNLLKDSLESFLKKNDEVTAEKEQSENVPAEGVKEKEPEGAVHDDSDDAEDESMETESEIERIGVGKVELKKKPQKRKKKESDDEDSTYMPTADEKKKLRIKRKAVQKGVIPRNVRAKKGGASVPESQSGKSEKHVETPKDIEAEKVQSVEVPKAPEVQSNEKPEDQKKAGTSNDEVEVTKVRVATTPPPPENLDVAESSQPKKTVLPEMFEGFPNVRREYKDDILSCDEFDMFHDASVKALEKKVSILEKEKAKAEADRDELKKQHEELVKANEFKAIKLEMEALRANKVMKDEQHNMLYNVMEHHLGIDVQSIYNNIEIKKVEERRIERERRLAEEATQRKKDVIMETQEAGGSSSQADVEMVDVEADQAQGFVLVGEATIPSYNFEEIIRRVLVEQRRKKAKEHKVLLLRWKDEENIVEEEEKEDEDLDDVLDAIYNYYRLWDDLIDKDDDDDQGATGLLIVNPSVQQKIEDFMNDEINEQEEDHQQESSSSGKKHADQEVDKYNDVFVEEGSDSSDEETMFHYAGVDETFPSLAKMFKEHNEDEVRRKIVEKITTEGVPRTIPRENLAEERKKWFKQAKDRFPDWKPQYPKQIVTILESGEKDITLDIKPPRCLKNMPLRAMEQDFHEEFQGILVVGVVGPV
ncbi:glutamic acid-rich protein-like [Helianthus annuus]|uniref:glutamic acid-rich protein-like n=1 Tax=Helianthus annuus TaxID=4232 RepID=UPI0016532213|nr:glutamic acid-rich protein-like [Helianthus annuus]